jgi:flagellar biogenesis protein FliO
MFGKGQQPTLPRIFFAKAARKSHTGNRYATGSSSWHKQPIWIWWILILVSGLGLIMLSALAPSVQSPDDIGASSSQPGVNDTPNALLNQGTYPETGQTGGDRSTAEGDSFLAEYDLSSSPFLDADPKLASTLNMAERPPLLVAAELGAKLILVIGLAYVVLAGLRWLQGNRYKSPGASSATINVLETTGLGPGRALHLVVVGEKTLLIGATEHQLSLLTELSDTAVSLPADMDIAEDEQFDQALDVQAAQPPVSPAQAQQESPPPTQPRVPVSDLHAALAGLRASVQRIRESAGE